MQYEEKPVMPIEVLRLKQIAANHLFNDTVAFNLII